MSTTAVQGYNAGYLNGIDDVGGIGGTNESQLAQLLELLIEEIKQILDPSSQNSGDAGGVGGIGGGTPSYSAPPAYAGGGGASPGIGGGGSGDGGSHGNTLPTVSGGDAAHAIAQDLKSRYGLTDAQVAGVLGNLQQESGLQGNVNQGGAKGAPSGNFADDNANGWGLAQWGGTRKQGEINYAKEHGLDPGSLEANIGFMNQELDTTYSKTITDIKQTTTAEQAALVWDKDYEQATDPQMENRNKYAEQFLAQGF
ncbi:phage tail tip lysozyme [Burkholderia ambifaria]|uniref:phage tail tip lysozyme n=1 Tax=Burkholderia ambifaria TaxID=152480 RepID=UPI00158D9495|nr:phage tail tip lysozyme [Burkholderia ambifaria]